MNALRVDYARLFVIHHECFPQNDPLSQAVIESNISSTGEGARGGESALTTLSSPNPAAEGSFEKGRRPHITSDITSSLETLREDNASLRDKLATSDGDGGQVGPRSVLG